MRRRLALGCVLIAAACCSKSDVKSSGSGSGPTPVAAEKPTFTLFAMAEMRGQIGPCGCTSDPLGDLSRTVQLVADTRAAGPTLVVDAGSLLYSKSPIPAQLDAQEELKADLLASTVKGELAVSTIGLGPADLSKGPSKVRLPRTIANLAPGSGIETIPGKIIDAPGLTGGTKVGVFGVAMPDVLTGIATVDPVAAGKAAVADLKSKGAQVIVGLFQAAQKKDAVKLMRDIGGIDIGIAGLGAAAPEPDRIEPEPQKVGDGWLIVPANRGQVVPKIEVTMRGAGPLADAIGSAAAVAKIESLDKRITAIDADLAKFANDPKADPQFIATMKTERDNLVGQRDQLKQQPLVVPASGSYFTLAQVRIHKALACSKTIDGRVTALYHATGEANVKAATAKPPVPAKGQPKYAGNATCEDCHADAAKFWKSTRHAQAWKTLVDRGQQFDFDCTGCHVTGWEKSGGSNLAFNEPLRDVQCETCHGPSSIHVEKGGEEKPFATLRAPAEDLCATQCHTKEHSDTFQHAAYMRDIVGPGHGEAARKKLGDGPTGAQLRKAALDKAGRSLGAGCSR
jgi:Cytochrome c554 and c-prime